MCDPALVTEVTNKLNSPSMISLGAGVGVSLRDGLLAVRSPRLESSGMVNDVTLIRSTSTSTVNKYSRVVCHYVKSR